MNVKKAWLVIALALCVSVFISWYVYIGVGGAERVSRSQKRAVAETIPIDPLKAYDVVDVVDGDTIKARIDGHAITIRLLGVNTPEVLDPRKEVECYGPEASTETKSLVSGRSVFLELNPDYERVDKYGRLLAYVRRSGDSMSINELLIKEGFGREYTFNEKKPYMRQALFRADQSAAQKEKRGLWGACGG